jgi:hypothetical protein
LSVPGVLAASAVRVLFIIVLLDDEVGTQTSPCRDARKSP